LVRYLIDPSQSDINYLKPPGKERKLGRDADLISRRRRFKFSEFSLCPFIILTRRSRERVLTAKCTSRRLSGEKRITKGAPGACSRTQMRGVSNFSSGRDLHL